MIATLVIAFFHLFSNNFLAINGLFGCLFLELRQEASLYINRSLFS